MMDPKLISGLHVAVDFTLRTDAAGLAKALEEVDSLRQSITAWPNVQSLHIGQMVELNGVFWEDGEPKTMRGILHALTPNDDDELAEAYICLECGMHKKHPFVVTRTAEGRYIECPQCKAHMKPDTEEADNG
jgi:DNA-directed RNA polymerase subunit RPC12/RpoP